MEILILLLVGILLVAGIIGSIIPVIPGPPISYAAVLLMHFFTPYQFDSYLLMTLASIVVFVTFLDYWLQIEGVKRFGGGKKATNGTIIGLLVGIFVFPPIGILVGPFLGAYIGAKMEDKSEEALKIAFGAIIGFLGGTFLKLLISGFIVYKVVLVFL
jgi:uncharacterized protein YqgC (DUF456 family)